MQTRLREGTEAAPGKAGAAAPNGPQRAGAPLRVSGAAHSFGELRVIQSIDLEAEPGEVVGVVGPSGCGKTTLLELIAGLREPDGGEISVDGREGADQRLARCAYMPQRDLLLPW